MRRHQLGCGEVRSLCSHPLESLPEMTDVDATSLVVGTDQKFLLLGADIKLHFGNTLEFRVSWA